MTTFFPRRRSSLHSIATLGLLTGVALTSSACLDHPVKGVTIRSQQESNVRVSLEVNKDVDILLVIDNSGSMGEEQRALANNFKSFIEVLEDPDVDANFRIGVTTTDLGGHFFPSCQGRGDAGLLRLKSCVDRRAEFKAPGPTGAIRYRTACTEKCKYKDSELKIKPTKVEDNDELLARRWIEKLDGETNLENKDISAAEAFECFGPQGISGCGYEQQLESMYQALRWAGRGPKDSKGKDNPNFGFIRKSAILAIINVTDEIDCSLNTNHPLLKSNTTEDKKKFIMSVFGNTNQKGVTAEETPFWVEGQKDASSAVCFRAGANCTGGSSGEYDECVSMDYDTKRNELSSDDAEDEAVLFPLSRYTDYVELLEAEKKKINENQEVIVALIGGVNEDGSVTYRVGGDAGTSTEKAHFTKFGIGFGCEEPSVPLPEEDAEGNTIEPDLNSMGYAIAPIRMAEFTTHFAQKSDKVMFKICSDDFSEPLRNIAQQIRDQIRPACYTECVKDDKPKTKELDPKCDVLQTVAGGSDEEEGGTKVVECEKNDKGYYEFEDGSYVIPKKEEVCYVLLADPTGDMTKDPNDNMDSDCVRVGQNLQFKIQRKKGARPPAGTSIKAVCELSSNKLADCPAVKKKDEFSFNF